ncbi:hypothetical protein [Xenorhabdus sp. PB62.4]|nr:hypothetical protein [Xenorhabdus sp. PB62.4]
MTILYSIQATEKVGGNSMKYQRLAQECCGHDTVVSAHSVQTAKKVIA